MIQTGLISCPTKIGTHQRFTLPLFIFLGSVLPSTTLGDPSDGGTIHPRHADAAGKVIDSRMVKQWAVHQATWKDRPRRPLGYRALSISHVVVIGFGPSTAVLRGKPSVKTHQKINYDSRT